jgi:hypothetical protein
MADLVRDQLRCDDWQAQGLHRGAAYTDDALRSRGEETR